MGQVGTRAPRYCPRWESLFKGRSESLFFLVTSTRSRPRGWFAKVSDDGCHGVWWGGCHWWDNLGTDWRVPAGESRRPNRQCLGHRFARPCNDRDMMMHNIFSTYTLNHTVLLLTWCQTRPRLCSYTVFQAPWYLANIGISLNFTLLPQFYSGCCHQTSTTQQRDIVGLVMSRCRLKMTYWWANALPDIVDEGALLAISL